MSLPALLDALEIQGPSTTSELVEVVQVLAETEVAQVLFRLRKSESLGKFNV